MMALQSGMTVYLANRHSLSEFMGWVKKYKIQTCSMTPQASNNMPVSDDERIRIFATSSAITIVAMSISRREAFWCACSRVVWDD